MYDASESFALSEAGSTDASGVPRIDSFTWNRAGSGTDSISLQAVPGASGTLNDTAQSSWQDAEAASGSAADYTFTDSQKTQDSYSTDEASTWTNQATGTAGAGSGTETHTYSAHGGGSGNTDLEEAGHVTAAGEDVGSFSWDDHSHDAGTTATSDARPDGSQSETSSYGGHFDLKEVGSKVGGAFAVSSFTLDDGQSNSSSGQGSEQTPAMPDGTGGGTTSWSDSSGSSSAEHAGSTVAGPAVSLGSYNASHTSDSGGGASSWAHDGRTVTGATPTFTEHREWSSSYGPGGSSDGPADQPGVALVGL